MCPKFGLAGGDLLDSPTGSVRVDDVGRDEFSREMCGDPPGGGERIGRNEGTSVRI